MAASDPQAIVEALATHEEAMSALYSGFAKQYPTIDLWQTLSREEYGHARMLRSLLAKAGDLEAYVEARGFDLDEIRRETAKLRNIAQLSEAAGFPLQEAFRAAVRLEDSIIESQVFAPTAQDTPEVTTVLDGLREQTLRHQRRLMESLA